MFTILLYAVETWMFKKNDAHRHLALCNEMIINYTYRQVKSQQKQDDQKKDQCETDSWECDKKEKSPAFSPYLVHERWPAAKDCVL